MKPNLPEAIWLNTSPSLQPFERPLMSYLSKQFTIARWEYIQDRDEASSLDVACTLLHDYLKSRPQPIHLIGHSTAGLLGLIYGRRHPERLKSLTLLGVGVHPAVDWQAHYYALRQLIPCNRQLVLQQMVKNIFGSQDSYTTKKLAKILEQDLSNSLSPHSIVERKSISPGGINAPLMICGSEDDSIVDLNAIQKWSNYLKEGDRLWQFSQGHHFFHYFYPRKVGRKITDFWRNVASFNGEELYTVSA